MIQEHISGYIVDIGVDGVAVIHAAIPNLDRALYRDYKNVEIIMNDGRRISPEQRRKCYALLGEIAEYVSGYRTAETVEEEKQHMKLEFMLKRMEGMERRLFSLADCDVTTAREFITFLIDFIIANDIPTRVPLIDNCDDIPAYVYACLVHKKCCVCGKHANLHHCEGGVIGMGNNRNKVDHIGRPALPLCNEHHNIIHQMGQADFMSKYHLVTIPIDKKIAKVYRLKAGDKHASDTRTEN